MRNSRAKAAVCALLIACGIFAAPLRSQKNSASVFSEDKGKFAIVIGGQTVGTEDFSISHEGDHWVARGTTEFHVQTGSYKVIGELRLNAAGAPLKYVWTTEGDKKASSTTEFDGLTAKITLNLGNGDKPISQDFTFASPVVVLDNNLYHQYEVLARVYNWAAGGPQNFAVLIPQQQTPGMVTAESRGSTMLDGMRFDQLAVHTTNLELMLYLDAAHRLIRLSVPASNAEIRRQ
ncbi:MAG: hypothetical protein WAM91_16190 [Candidatus Acidiferrales bacterium]